MDKREEKRGERERGGEEGGGGGGGGGVHTRNSAVPRIPRACDDVEAVRSTSGARLHAYHARDELWVVREVGVHDDDEVARRELQPVHVRRAEAELASARAQLHACRAVHALQLLSNGLRAVGRRVVNDDNLPVEVAKFR